MSPETVELTDIILRILGAFYAFAGFVATRAAIMSQFLDRAIAAIAAQKPSTRETALNAWLLAGAAIVLVSGLLLLGGLRPAVWAFTLSTLTQAAYLFVLAPRYFDVDDPPDPAGRRATTNAFVIYAAATAYVAWADWRGRLISVDEASTPVLTAIGIALALYAIYVARLLWWLPKKQPGGGLLGGFAAGGNDDPSRPLHEAQRVKIMAEYQCDPLWAIDEDLYGCFAPADLGISPELVADFGTWASAYDNSYDPDDPLNPRWTAEEQAAHAAEERALAVRLKRERPDLMVYVLEPEIGVVEVHADEPIGGGAAVTTPPG